MTYEQVARDLDIARVCFGGCGLNDYRHRGCIYLGVIHWQERRLTRRGLRRFLLLVARRERLGDLEFLNDKHLGFFHLWYDEQVANAYAAELGHRFPVSYSKVERLRCLSLLHRRRSFSVSYPTILAWARRGEA